MPIYEFECHEGGERQEKTMKVQDYVELMRRGPACDEHGCGLKRIFGRFTFRMDS